MKRDEYDWIDDAFDESKQDPLALKGMTGCSSLAVLGAGVIAVLIVGLIAIVSILPGLGA